MKKLISTLVGGLVTLVLLNAAPATEFNKAKAVADKKAAVTFHDVKGLQFVKDMKTGWNLGNTFDANSTKGMASETCWGMPKTTKPMIDKLAASGIKTIRIPVSWSNHLIDNNYTVDPEWMTRVKTVVDWAIDAKMYVILNIHHDNYERNAPIPKGKGYYPTEANYAESERFISNIWAQISLAFNNGYDEHLIFEVLNEPRMRNTRHEWSNDKSSKEYAEEAECLNKLNQVAVDTIRASGGNNKKRFIMIPGLAASLDSVTDKAFRLPKDVIADRLIISIHAYSPYKFAMEAPGVNIFANIHKIELNSLFKRLDTEFISKGIPVVIGEYGATNKDNLEARVNWFSFYISQAKKYGITCVLWDNGQSAPSKNEGERFGYYNRSAQKWYFPEILNAIVEAAK
ncbi:MAG: glycoside hydrolase family 5 protein [Treponema sp.]|nr:glycoside hydrolase family 5 protein [Treponema sp.]